MATHVHRPAGSEVDAPGWRYTILDEGLARADGKEYAFIIGSASAGSACCGSGEVRFIHVTGSVRSWKSMRDAQGLALSEVEPVRDEAEQERIRMQLADLHPGLQVCFWPAGGHDDGKTGP